MTRTLHGRWLAAILLFSTACDPDSGDPVVERRSGADVPADARAAEVIFSPQPLDATHNRRIAELIAAAQASIDVALYGLDDAAVEAALRDAAARGVKIRLIYEGARDDRELDADARASSGSGRLEAAGIDVRYVNKIMHHKFMIVDGPRDDLDATATATLVTGSANWSDAAATRYDENTLFLRGYAELVLRMQAEFNLMWDHSRDFAIDEPLPFEPSGVAISEADIVDVADTHALFTSANFELIGDTTFTATGQSTVGDALVAAIADATISIRIASGHLRDRGVAEALMAKAWEAPDMDIRVYLDGQEFVSEADHAEQLADLRRCLVVTDGDEAAWRDCLEGGFRFGYLVELAGVDVRYKWYSYYWIYALADQMHHKYMIIDGDELWTGSYNLSSNAEHNSMENMLRFSGPENAELIAEYVANFEELWITGRSEGLREDLCEAIENAGEHAEDCPLWFEPMALEWEEIRDVRALFEASCPGLP